MSKISGRHDWTFGGSILRLWRKISQEFVSTLTEQARSRNGPPSITLLASYSATEGCNEHSPSSHSSSSLSLPSTPSDPDLSEQSSSLLRISFSVQALDTSSSPECCSGSSSSAAPVLRQSHSPAQKSQMLERRHQQRQVMSTKRNATPASALETLQHQAHPSLLHCSRSIATNPSTRLLHFLCPSSPTQALGSKPIRAIVPFVEDPSFWPLCWTQASPEPCGGHSPRFAVPLSCANPPNPRSRHTRWFLSCCLNV